MIYLKIRVRINPIKQNEFDQAVAHLLESVNCNGRHFEFDLTKSVDDSTLYLYTEEWQDKEALHEHLSTDIFHALLGAMKVLGDIIDSRIIYSSGEEELVLLSLIHI